MLEFLLDTNTVQGRLQGNLDCPSTAGTSCEPTVGPRVLVVTADPVLSLGFRYGKFKEVIQTHFLVMRASRHTHRTHSHKYRHTPDVAYFKTEY